MSTYTEDQLQQAIGAERSRCALIHKHPRAAAVPAVAANLMHSGASVTEAYRQINAAADALAAMPAQAGGAGQNANSRSTTGDAHMHEGTVEASWDRAFNVKGNTDGIV